VLGYTSSMDTVNTNSSYSPIALCLSFYVF